MGSFLKLASLRTFTFNLKTKIKDHNVTNGAAALAYYLMFSLFPAALFCISLLPFLPIPNLYSAIMEFLKEVLPGETAGLLSGTLNEITSHRQTGLLSIGLFLTLWAASNGLYAIMQQLNVTYSVKEGRPFWKARGTALFLTVLFTFLVLGSFALVIFGGVLEQLITSLIGPSPIWVGIFAVLRWGIIILALTFGFSATYYFGPDIKHKFKLVSPGSVAAVFLFISSSLVFRFYVENFGSYNVTYGSLGAVIVMLLWLYIAGLVILLGGEINALKELPGPSEQAKQKWKAAG
jgi:membrane protein